MSGSCAEPDKEGRCRYCGSMSVEKAIEMLQTPGVRYSGCDWKYGWPHKFYIDPPDGQDSFGTRKFYAVHLGLVSNALCVQFAELCVALLGVHYVQKGSAPGNGIMYKAPRGFQTWGCVGQTHPGEMWRKSLDFGPPVPEYMIGRKH